MKISKRLIEISNLIEDNSNIIDVGCDHALLDIYLFKNKKNVKIIASDIKEGPLEQAKRNISKFKYPIRVKLGSGLDPIEEDIDTVVIAGMGGDTIIDILQKGKDKLKNVKKMILSPQSEWKRIRECMVSLGFYIEDEKLIEDGNKYYLIIKVAKGIKKYSDKELEYGPLLLKEKSSIFIDFYSKELNAKKNVIKNIPKIKVRKRVHEIRKIKELERLVKE